MPLIEKPDIDNLSLSDIFTSWGVSIFANCLNLVWIKGTRGESSGKVSFENTLNNFGYFVTIPLSAFFDVVGEIFLFS